MNHEMSPVVGTSSVVGFAHNGSDNHSGHSYSFSGISDKDQGFHSAVDAGERTRDVLSGQRLSDKNASDAHTSTALAVERNGAANGLATEKTGAAALVQAERLNADHIAQIDRINLSQVQALAEIRLESQRSANDTQRLLAECCCKMESTVRELDTNRLRDDLAQVRAELTAAAGK